ncbi:MAG: peptidoglycan-binding protein [Patescibacteria group bacterium]
MFFLPLKGNISLALLVLGTLVAGILVLGPKPELKSIVSIDSHMLAAAAADALPQTSSIPKPSFCPSFTGALYLGSKDSGKNTNVSNLQKFLLQFTGIYPNGAVNGSFDIATESALGRFQTDRKVAKPGEAGYGILGPKTRASIDILCGRKTIVSTPVSVSKPTPNFSYRVNVNTSISGGSEKISVHAEAVNKGSTSAIVSIPTACTRFTELLKQIDILDGKNIPAIFPCASVVTADSVSAGVSRAWDYVSRSGTTTPATSSGGLSVVPGTGGYYSAPYTSPAVAFNVRVETQIDGSITSYIISVIAENRGSIPATVDTAQSCPSVYNAISSFGISVQPSNLFSCDSRLAGVYLSAGEKKTFQSTYRLGNPTVTLAGTLSINVATTKGSYASGEDITFIATLQNGTGQDKTISATGCGDPAVVSYDILNGSQKVNNESTATCQAFVFMSIPSGTSKTIPVTYNPATPLPAGSYGLTARVSGFGSAATSFTVTSNQICPAVAACPAGFTGATSINSNGCSVITCTPSSPQICPAVANCPAGYKSSFSTNSNGCQVIECKANSCQADLDTAKEIDTITNCLQKGPLRSCPDDSTFTTQTLNCESGYLQSRGWSTAQ